MWNLLQQLRKKSRRRHESKVRCLDVAMTSSMGVHCKDKEEAMFCSPSVGKSLRVMW